MPSRVTYMNQSAPFWDFIANMEQQGSNPWSPQNGNEHEHNEGQHTAQHTAQPPFGPWGWGQFFGGGRGMPHRGPPPSGPSPSGPPPHEHHDSTGEKDGEGHEDNEDNDNDNDNGKGTPDESGSDNEGCSRGHGRHGRCGGRRGHGSGGPGGFEHRHGPRGHGPHRGPHHGPPHGGPGPHHDGSRRGGRGPRGPCGRGPWGRGGPFGGGPFGGRFGGFDPSTLANNFWNQFVNPEASPANADNTGDFSPQADIFDTPSSFVIHVSLPGAKKEDVGVNWDAEKSELNIAGVIYRPGDEEFLKTLALNERSVGPFERKIRLGTRAVPAQIDVEGISAKLEDGLLRVEVPKLKETGFVEIKKVDIE